MGGIVAEFHRPSKKVRIADWARIRVIKVYHETRTGVIHTFGGYLEQFLQPNFLVDLVQFSCYTGMIQPAKSTGPAIFITRRLPMHQVGGSEGTTIPPFTRQA